jgi:hypothetical protein
MTAVQSKRGEVRSGFPPLRRLFQLMRDQEMSFADMDGEAGVPAGTLTRWYRRRVSPSPELLEMCFNALGYELVAVPIEAGLVDAAPSLPVPHLTPREGALVDILHNRLGRTVRAPFILDRLAMTDGTLKVLVGRIRGKFAGTGWHLDTVRGLGYRLTKK